MLLNIYLKIFKNLEVQRSAHIFVEPEILVEIIYKITITGFCAVFLFEYQLVFN